MNDDELRDWFEIGRLSGIFDFSRIKDDEGNEVCDTYETALDFLGKYTDWLHSCKPTESDKDQEGFIHAYATSQEKIADNLDIIISDAVMDYDNPCFSWENHGRLNNGVVLIHVEYDFDIVQFAIQEDSSIKVIHGSEAKVFSKDELDKVEAYLLRWVLQMTESA